ncbi:MAG: hypothetical protein RLZZ435_1303 [Cyanobacteriota bacterium]|jgi:hypothetical protein
MVFVGWAIATMHRDVLKFSNFSLTVESLTLGYTRTIVEYVLSSDPERIHYYERLSSVSYAMPLL